MNNIALNNTLRTKAIYSEIHSSFSHPKTVTVIRCVPSMSECDQQFCVFSLNEADWRKKNWLHLWAKMNIEGLIYWCTITLVHFPISTCSISSDDNNFKANCFNFSDGFPDSTSAVIPVVAK